MKRTMQWVMGFATAVFTMSIAQANVSIRNGNYFISYTDLEYAGGFGTKVDRVYNSKTPYNGMFGWGWGNEYEVFLVVSADGSVVVHEYGGGAQNRFDPTSFNAAELSKAVDLIVDAAKKTGTVSSADQLASYKSRLTTDAQYRNDEWNKYRQAGKVAARKLPVGAKLTSNRFAFQYLVVTNNGYQRISDSGKIEAFDTNGRLLKVQDKAGNHITITYTKDGLWEKVVDNSNRKMFFTFNKNRKVIKVQGESKKIAEYQYNDQDELIQAKDEQGGVYRYKYSNDKRHNLVQVDGPDASMQIAYYGKDKLENVKSIKDKDGTVTEYDYENVGAGKDWLKVGVKVKGTDGKVITQSKYDYQFRRKPTGEEWTYRLTTDLDGMKTETTYNECCALPILIKRGSEETTFAYDPRGRLLKKVTPNEVTELSYDAKAGKVAQVKTARKGAGAKSEWSQFKYDTKGNLVFAKNSSGLGVQLLYDAQSRIKTMVDHKKRRLDFKYNENNKPVEIRDPKLGAIAVTYNNAGDVQSVDSKGGRDIASQVSGAFQNLLELIRPAGVSLSF